MMISCTRDKKCKAQAGYFVWFISAWLHLSPALVALYILQLFLEKHKMDHFMKKWDHPSVTRYCLSKTTPWSASFSLSVSLTLPLYTHAKTHRERVPYVEQKDKNLTWNLHSRGSSPARDEFSRLFPLKGDQCHTALRLFSDLSLRSPTGPRACCVSLTFFFTFLTGGMRLAEISFVISASPFTCRSGFLLYRLPTQAGISFKKRELLAAPSLSLLNFRNLLPTPYFLSPV